MSDDNDGGMGWLAGLDWSSFVCELFELGFRLEFLGLLESADHSNLTI